MKDHAESSIHGCWYFHSFTIKNYQALNGATAQEVPILLVYREKQASFGPWTSGPCDVRLPSPSLCNSYELYCSLACVPGLLTSGMPWRDCRFGAEIMNTSCWGEENLSYFSLPYELWALSAGQPRANGEKQRWKNRRAGENFLIVIRASFTRPSFSIWSWREREKPESHGLVFQFVYST